MIIIIIIMLMIITNGDGDIMGREGRSEGGRDKD